MKKIILSFVLLLLSSFVYSQTEYAKMIPDDIIVIDSLKSLYSPDQCKLIVYQTGGYEKLCISSVIFINTNNTTNYWIVLFDKDDVENKYDASYSYIVKYGGELKDSLMFSYPFYLNTGTTKREFEEQESDFPTPSRIADVICYFDIRVSFYFDDDTGKISRKNENYKYRREWLGIIKESLRPIFKEYCADYWSFFKDSLE